MLLVCNFTKVALRMDMWISEYSRNSFLFSNCRLALKTSNLLKGSLGKLLTYKLKSFFDSIYYFQIIIDSYFIYLYIVCKWTSRDKDKEKLAKTITSHKKMKFDEIAAQDKIRRDF